MTFMGLIKDLITVKQLRPGRGQGLEALIVSLIIETMMETLRYTRALQESCQGFVRL